jgi:site-specific recombinase XerD
VATAAHRPPTLTFERAWQDFVVHRRAENMSPRTLAAYRVAAHQLVDFLTAAGLPTGPMEITRQGVQEYITHVVLTRSAATASTRYWGLRAFFNWLVDEGEIDHSPLERVRPPRQEERPPDVLSDEEVLALLHAAEGRSFEDRRDAAIIRLLFDTGARVGELVSMTTDGVSVADATARVMGKGRRERDLAFGMKTAKDLTRYLRLREGHRLAESTQFWLGWHGPLTESGVAQALKARAERAGLDAAKVHPHILRHTFADRWKAAGGSEEDLMSLGGWPSPTAMRRYGSSLAAARAREAHRRLSPGDRL